MENERTRTWCPATPITVELLTQAFWISNEQQRAHLADITEFIGLLLDAIEGIHVDRPECGDRPA